MSVEERKKKIDSNKAINSKKTVKSRFMKWAKAHKGAFVITDSELKANLASLS